MCVCSCVCVFCTCAYMCVRASMCVMSCVRASVCTCVCTGVCAHVPLCVCVCVCMWCVCMCVSVCVHVCVRVCVWCVCVRVSACTHSNPTHVFWYTVLQKPFAPWTPRRNPQSVPKSAVQVLLHESKKQVKHNNKISSLCQNLLSRCYFMNLKSRWNTTMKSPVCPKICCPVVTSWIWNTRVTVVGGVGGGLSWPDWGTPWCCPRVPQKGNETRDWGLPRKEQDQRLVASELGYCLPPPPPR